jgi:hypothetical protein
LVAKPLEVKELLCKVGRWRQVVRYWRLAALALGQRSGFIKNIIGSISSSNVNIGTILLRDSFNDDGVSRGHHPPLIEA